MGPGEKKKRFNIENENGDVSGLKNSQNVFWGKIKSARTFSNKNHSKIFCRLGIEKRTEQPFLSFPRFLWLGLKVVKSYKIFEIQHLKSSI